MKKLYNLRYLRHLTLDLMILAGQRRIPHRLRQWPRRLRQSYSNETHCLVWQLMSHDILPCHISVICDILSCHMVCISVSHLYVTSIWHMTYCSVTSVRHMTYCHVTSVWHESQGVNLLRVTWHIVVSHGVYLFVTWPTPTLWEISLLLFRFSDFKPCQTNRIVTLF